LFRLKIALFSVLLSGSVLVGLGFYSLSVINEVGTARMDREILALGEGHLAVRPPQGYWQNFETSLRFIYGEKRSDNLIVQIKDANNQILFKSPHWPAEISEDSFPGFDRAMDTRPPGPDGGRIRPSGPDGENRRSPPLEAYKVCEGKRAGSPAQIVNHRGETLTGTCEEEDGKLVLRPDANKGIRQGQGRDGPGNRPLPPSKPVNEPDSRVPRIKKTPYFATIQTSSGTWRTGIMGSDRVTMLVGMNMASVYEDGARYRRALLYTVPLALLFLAIGGWIIARRALRPVGLITRTAEGITGRALDQRVPEVRGDNELSRLAGVINLMLDRLEKNFHQAVRFSADAAHELQTPLTVLQGELEDAVQHAAVGSEEQRRYSDLLEEVHQLKAIVQKLLILARADAGRLELRLETTDLSAMVESAAEDADAMAPHLTIEKDVVPGVMVKADRDLMGQVIRNLTSNAVKYNREKGLIRFRVSIGHNEALLAISNTGDPIPEEDREKIFERFYRVDQSRSRKVAGAGLGLSIAREIIHAHGGNLFLDLNSGDMISFTLSLPWSSC
jgi:two-component system, OmpR family, heavy metal sensor histidine kinase CusS